MKSQESDNARRTFLCEIAAGAAAIGMLGITPATASPNKSATSEGGWLDKINGKHRVVFDVPQPHGLFPFAWPRVFLLTNQATGTPEKENSVVVVLRHNSIPYAMSDSLWTKYNFGEVFKVEDPATKAIANKNPFWQPSPGSFKVPGFGPVAIGINELQDSGVQFVVCDAAITVNSAVVADKMKLDPATVKQEWLQGVLPGITPVPSGLWALGRAQEHGCGYIFVG